MAPPNNFPEKEESQQRVCSRAVPSGTCSYVPTSKTTLFTKRLPCFIYLFSFTSNSSLTQPSNFLITNPFASKSTPNRQAEPGGRLCKFAHTPTSWIKGNSRSKKLCMCKKVDLGTRIAEFVYRAETPQFGCQSYQELESKLAKAHVCIPGATGGPESADRISGRGSSEGQNGERCRSTCSCCRSRAPTPVLERGGGASTRRLSLSV